MLQASVGGQNPTGTVTYHDGDNALGSATLVSGQATLKISSLTVGTHHLSADYSGDANVSVQPVHL